MTQGIEVASRRVQAAALLLIACLAAGPVSTHVYWTLGGTLYTNGVRDEVADTGTRVVAAVVVVLLVAAVLVVLARVGLCSSLSRPDDSVLRLGAGGGLPARDAGGLHLE